MVAPAVAAITLAACARAGSPAGPETPALFYAKGGQIYVSSPAGSPGRRLTEGPGDSQPAPSPDGKRVAYIRRPATNNAAPEQPGGELWVLDVASGDARRLVDPAAVAPKSDGDLQTVDTPRWSPTGDRIAFLKSSYAGGGSLMTASADTGAVTAPAPSLFADGDYDWAPDGRHILWSGGRSDVSPVDVSVLTVGESSIPVAKATNAFSVGYAEDGSTVLFANGDATQSMFSSIPFALRAGGVFSVRPPAAPQSLITGAAYYGDVAGLPGGAIAFTEAAADVRTKTIKVLDRDGRSTRTVDETAGSAQGPAWAGDSVAYVGTAADKPLLVREVDGEARRVDADVDSFAWSR